MNKSVQNNYPLTWLGPLFLFLTMAFILSCQSGKPDLVGKWRPLTVDPKFMQSYGMSNSDIEEMTKNAELEFTSTGKFNSVMPHDTSSGSYLYDAKEKTVITTGQDGRKLTYTIDVLEKEKLQMSSPFGQITLSRE